MNNIKMILDLREDNILTQKQIFQYGKKNENIAKKFINSWNNWKCIKANSVLDKYCKIDLLAFKKENGKTIIYGIQVKGSHAVFSKAHKTRLIEYCTKRNYVPWLVIIKNSKVLAINKMTKDA